MFTKIMITLVAAIALLGVMGTGSTANAAPPGSNAVLTVDAVADVNDVVSVQGEGFPKKAATFVITAQVSPIFSGDFPSILVETDKKGSFEVFTSFDEVGTYEIHTCFRFKQRGGGWDCRTADTVSIEIINP